MAEPGGSDRNGRFSGRAAIVTGAGGFIGAALCRALAADGASVTGIDVAERAAGTVEASGATFRRGDVTDAAAMRNALSGADLVVHTAAFIHEGGAMDEFVALNLGGTIALLDAAREAGVERFVHLSSVVVYGYEDESLQDEDAPLRAVGIPYLDTKSSSDRVARRGGAVVIRPGDVYGPDSVPWTLRPLELAASGRLAVPAPGTQRMLPVYIDDLVEAILLGALRGEPGRAYAAWSGEEVTFKEYFDGLAALVGGRCRVLPAPLMRVASHALAASARMRGAAPELGPNALTFVDRRGSVATARIRAELGWAPAVSLAEGLSRIARRRGLENGSDTRLVVTSASAGASP